MNLNDKINDAMEFMDRTVVVLNLLENYNSLLNKENSLWSEGYKICICKKIYEETEKKVKIIVDEINKKYSEIPKALSVKDKMQKDLESLRGKTLNLTLDLKRL